MPATNPWTITPAIATVLFLALVLYALARALRGTLFGGIVRGLSITLAVVSGTTILSSILLRQHDVARVLDILLPAVTICLVVLFQPEIRRALLRVGGPGLPLGPPPSREALEEAFRAVEWLARDRRGAILVFERGTGLAELAHTGVDVDAALRAETVLAAFAPGSPLHDGALVVRGDRVVAAGCTLPLARGDVPGTAGFRHRAALGLSEQTDAVAVVVSEETGQISVARDGTLTALPDAAALRGELAGLVERATR